MSGCDVIPSMAHDYALAPQRPSVTPAVLREQEAAFYIGRSRAYLKKSRVVGVGPAFVRVWRSITYRVRDLDAWLDDHVVRPAA